MRLIDTAGHCSICHSNYPANVHHGCGGTPTPCGPSCGNKVVPFVGGPTQYAADSSTDAVARVIRSNRWRAQSMVALQAEQFERELRELGYVIVEAP